VPSLAAQIRAYRTGQPPQLFPAVRGSRLG
jgi:hypothetical protein